MHSKMTECQGQEHSAGSKKLFPQLEEKGCTYRGTEGTQAPWAQPHNWVPNKMEIERNDDCHSTWKGQSHFPGIVWWLICTLPHPNLAGYWRVGVNPQGTASSTRIYRRSFWRGVCEHLLPQASAPPFCCISPGRRCWGHWPDQVNNKTKSWHTSTTNMEGQTSRSLWMLPVSWALGSKQSKSALTTCTYVQQTYQVNDNYIFHKNTMFL